MNKFCELCDSVATKFDKDMQMFLCAKDFKSFNFQVVDVDFNEEW